MKTITNYVCKRFDRTVKEQEPDMSGQPDGPNTLVNPVRPGVLAGKTERGGERPETRRGLPLQGLGSLSSLLVGSVTSDHFIYLFLCLFIPSPSLYGDGW